MVAKFNYTLKKRQLSTLLQPSFVGKISELTKVFELNIFHFGLQDSWSSDEGEGISVEELKQTEGYQLFKEALQAHAKNSAKSV